MRRASLLWPRAGMTALLLAGAALAQPSEADKVTATALFKEGRALLEARRFPEACAKLEESQRLDPGGGTLLNLAICHEQEGKTATAWSEMTEALGVARRDGRAERVKLAEEHIAALEARLSRLRIVVPPASLVPELEVKRDGVVVRPGAWATGIPVDPGEHVVTASAPGHLPWSSRVPVTEKNTVTVEIPRLAASAAKPPLPPPGATAAPAAAASSAPPPSPPSPPPEDPRAQARSRTGYVMVITGAAALAFGTGYALTAMSRRDESDRLCVGGCTPDGVTANDSAKKAADTATAFFAVGLVAAGLGAYLVLTPPAAPQTARLVPTASPKGGSLALDVRF